MSWERSVGRDSHRGELVGAAPGTKPDATAGSRGSRAQRAHTTNPPPIGRPGNTWSSSLVILRSALRCREWSVESTVGPPVDEVADGGAVLQPERRSIFF